MLRFGRCALDVAGRRLLVDGTPVHLEPQAFDVLAHLAANPERVVSKEELLDAVWGSRFVSEAALATRIKEIRRATGDDGAVQGVVRTVRGRGYSLVVEPAQGGDDERPAGTGLLGRERDVTEALARLRPGSVVSLVGPGGVGKSTLARELVARLTADGRRVVTVDLTAIRDAGHLLPAVSRAAGVVGEAPQEALAGLDAVLVLDDADELVADVAALCSRLAGSGGRLAIVVTCRERLGCRGEQLWPVLPLDSATARELLRARCRELAPLGGLVDAPADRLDDLGAAVDRLPLALEMLAAGSAVEDVEGLRTLLDTRPDLLPAAQRDAPDRHRTLERLAAFSIQRLDDDLRAALVALGAFAGAFTSADAAGVLGAQGPAAVRALADRSLLAPVAALGAPRFQVLRTVYRALASAADPAQVVAASSAHATYVVRTLRFADEQLRTAQEAAAAAVFDRLADEARAAYRWAHTHDVPTAVALVRALHPYAYTRLWDEPFAWAQELSAVTEAPEVLAALATRAAQQSRLDDAATLATRVLAATTDDDLRTLALECLSDVGIYRYDTDAAVAAAEELLADGERTADRHRLAIGWTNSILARTYGGRAHEAAALLPTVERLTPDAPSDRAWLAYTRGETLAELGEPGAAAELARAKELADSVGNPFVGGVARVSLAAALARSATAADAEPALREALGTFLRRGNVTHLTSALRIAVPVLSALGHEEAAVIVGSWVLAPERRPAHPADRQVAQQVVDAAASRPGGPVWAARGRALSTAEAAEVALAALVPV